LSPSAVPRITDESTAKQDPELAVLSAVAHGRDVDTETVLQIALAAEVALLDLDAERSTLYRDILSEALSEAARRALQSMNPEKYQYRSEFAKRYYGQGLAEGRAELILKLLTLRFGDLPEAARTAIQAARIEELDRVGERLLTAASLEQALGKP